MNPEQYGYCRDQFARISAWFDRIDEVQKIIELYDQRFLTPANNELRYSFRHFLLAISKEADSDIKANIDLCEDHCKNTLYDVYSCATRVIIIYIHDFYEEFSDLDNFYTLTDWVHYLKIVEEIRKFIHENKKLDVITNIENFTILDQGLLDLLEISRQLTLVRPEFVKLRAKLASQVIKNRNNSIFLSILIPLLLAAIGWVLSLLALI